METTLKDLCVLRIAMDTTVLCFALRILVVKTVKPTTTQENPREPDEHPREPKRTEENPRCLRQRASGFDPREPKRTKDNPTEPKRTQENPREPQRTQENTTRTQENPREPKSTQDDSDDGSEQCRLGKELVQKDQGEIKDKQEKLRLFGCSKTKKRTSNKRK